MDRRRKKLAHMLSKGYDINIFLEKKLMVYTALHPGIMFNISSMNVYLYQN